MTPPKGKPKKVQKGTDSSGSDSLESLCLQWMQSRGWSPQDFQKNTWQHYQEGQSGMVNAPTGSGKTYSLMLPFLMNLKQQLPLKSGLYGLWITPIRALAKEIKISAERVIHDQQLPITVGIRSGDTMVEERAAQNKEWPNLLITTPESLHLMLAKKGATERLKLLKVVVADEWHELVGSKRGVQMELAISRLKGICPELKIWGISATICNLEEAMLMLLGMDRAGILVKANIKKEIRVASIMPDEVEKMPWAGHLGVKMVKQILPIIHQSKSTLIFTNTRAQCEVWYRHLLNADAELAGQMAMHHGSVSKELRFWVEDALYDGLLKAVICTSSLDLGVDFAPVETIIQIGGPKGIARFLQRAGRSGHRPHAASTIYFLPTHSLELIEAAALRQAVEEVYLEERVPMTRCFDVLVQYLVTLSVGDGFDRHEILHEVRNTLCFESMSNAEWDWALTFITTGGASLGAYEEYKKVSVVEGRFKVANQRIARKHRLSIGTIVGDTMMAVKLNKGGLLGHVEESFIASLNIGDAFWFAGQALELVKIKELTAYAIRTKVTTGKIPSWQGGKLPLSSRMSDMLREKLNQSVNGNPKKDPELDKIAPLLALQSERSMIPASNEFLIEIFRSDEGHHAVFYPFEGRSVHEGLASLFAHRIGRLFPISLSLAYNDYGFELLSDQPIPIEEALGADLLDIHQLEEDVLHGINSVELARRKFRDIAAISGLVFKGYPGAPTKDRHLQSSTQLIFSVFQDYDAGSLLLKQAYEEVMEYQLEMPRLRKALNRIIEQNVIIQYPESPTPFAFPIMVDRLREKMSSETLEDRVEKMTLDFTS